MPLPRIYFEKLLENSPDIVVAVDRRGSIVFYNDGPARTLGLHVRRGPREAGHPALQEPRARPRSAARNAQRRGRTERHGQELRDRLRGQGRTDLPVAISGSITYDDEGQEVGSIGFAKDLRQIRKRDRLLTLGELAVSLAHEINNPLEVITNTMELLAGLRAPHAPPTSNGDRGERFEAVEREVAKIHAIVSRVQGLAAGDAYETRQYLPGTLMTDLRQGAAVRARASGRRARQNGGQTPSIAGLTILVVDDDLGVCQSLAELLRHQGCTAVIATSAIDALRIATTQHFDLVVSDVVMPDMDGYDLYMELKERRRELPVILMTGYLYDRDHVIKRTQARGARDRRALQETDRPRAAEDHHPHPLLSEGGT
jgi:PAS domain S-box-containing protein